MTLTKKKTYWLLLAIILLGALLRYWALDFALPNLARPDENHISQIVVLRILASFFHSAPDLNPHFFLYPSLFIYLSTLVTSVYYLVGYWLGYFADGQAFQALYSTDWSNFHLIQRGISATAGVFSIPAMYALGKQISCQRLVGLMAAFLMAVAYLPIRDAHFGVTDIFALLWVVICLYHTVRYAQLGKNSDLYKAACFAGIAGTSKYPAGLVAIGFYVAYFLRLSVQTGSWKKTLQELLTSIPEMKTLFTATLVLVVIFFLGTPYALLSPVEFWENIAFQKASVESQQFGNMSPGWFYHLQFSLWYGLGPLLLLTGLAGFLKSLVNRQTLIQCIPYVSILAFALLYYVANGPTQYVFARYALPFVPIVLLCSALLINEISQWISIRFGLPVSKQAYVTLPLLVIISLPTLISSVRYDEVLGNKDTRSEARDWLIAHLKTGEGVGIGKVLTHVDLPAEYKRYFLAVPSRGFNYQTYLEDYYYDPNAKFVNSPTNRNEYSLSTYSDVPMLRKQGIRYVVLGNVSQPIYAVPSFERDAVLAQPGLKKVAAFSPYYPNEAPVPAKDYDQIDGFFVPYTDPGLVKRSGPFIEIFEVLAE